MDFYYPYICGVHNNKNDFQKNLKDFYVEGLGIKCVKEEPWVTIAESCECVIAALVLGDEEKLRRFLTIYSNLKMIMVFSLQAINMRWIFSGQKRIQHGLMQL
jgi:hypothetical protein